MKVEIKSIGDAYNYLLESGAVDIKRKTVEGKLLLNLCGYSTDTSQYIERQIKKHGFTRGVDYTLGIDVYSKSRIKPRVYQFNLDAASMVVLKSLGGIITHTRSRMESNFGTLLKSAFYNDVIESQYHVNGRFIDFYMPRYNLAIEFDEAYHDSNANSDGIRQLGIENYLGCSFIRVREGDEGVAIVNILKHIQTNNKQA